MTDEFFEEQQTAALSHVKKLEIKLEAATTRESGRTATDRPLPFLLQYDPAHTAAVGRAVDIMVEEAKLKYELTTEWNAFPLLDWSQFLVMKLNEAKRSRPMNFSTIRHLQNFLACA